MRDAACAFGRDAEAETASRDIVLIKIILSFTTPTRGASQMVEQIRYTSVAA